MRRSTVRACRALFLAALAAAAHAAEAAAEPVRARGDAVGVRGALAAGPFEVAGAGRPQAVTLLELDAPRVEGLLFQVAGTVRTEGVAPAGYLEMWTHFPDGSRYFSRTLAERGPIGKLEGTQAERPFVLPFQTAPGAPPPLKLVVNVVLPGAGRVTLRDLRFDGAASGAALGEEAGWWSSQTGGVVGAVVGSAVGLLGALIGTLCALGWGRSLVLGLLAALAVFGAASVAVGLAALALGQPYAVWYPMLLGGGIPLVLALGLRGSVRRRFDEAELRRRAATA
jgi:hypothetical protein